MKNHNRHVRAFRFFGWLIQPFIIRKFNYSYDSLSDIDGPYMLLCNHNTDVDPIFLGLATKKQVYFVATEKILRMGLLSRFVMFFFHPIIHYKGKMGINSVKEMLSTLKSGQNVAIFPEGNRSFNGLTNDFVLTIGKVAKKSGATLVTYRLNGAYFTSPRWSTTMRRGKLVGTKVNVYSPEMLKSMSDNQINDAIRTDIYEDAYFEQTKNPIAYRGKKLAEGLESTLFMCPKCKVIGCMSTKDNEISCQCGFWMTYDEYGYLTDEVGEKHTITELDRMQRKHLTELCSQDKKLFHDSIIFEDIDSSHQTISRKKAELCAYRDRLILDDFEIPFVEISGIAIQQRNILILHYNDRHVEIFGDIGFSALKYLYLFQESVKNNE